MGRRGRKHRGGEFLVSPRSFEWTFPQTRRDEWEPRRSINFKSQRPRLVGTPSGLMFTATPDPPEAA